MRSRYPYGLGMAPEAIDQIIADAKRSAQELAADPEVKPAGEHGGARTADMNGQVAIGHLSETSSTSVDRIVRRLKRDAPEIADALGRGEYPSARAAGIAAGITSHPCADVQVSPLPADLPCR